MADFLKIISELFQQPLSEPIVIFGLLMLIVLLVPIIFEKMKIPGIIGLILSGIVIGPYGYQILENNAAINIFSSIGLLYIMFIVGIELDMKEFRQNKHKAATFGALTFIIPFLFGFPTCYYLLGYPFYSSVLISAMFATHTLVSYPIVSHLGIARDKAVSITVGGTIVTDAAVLLLLEFIIKGNEGAFNMMYILQMFISISLFVVIVFVFIPWLTNIFLHKMENEKYAHYIFVMFVLFFSAILAKISGLEPLIGAFAAGLAINRHIPHSSALMNRIDFIGNSLFIPIFFISVGMMINIHVALQGLNILYISAVLLIVGILGKWVAAFFTQRIFKLSRLQRELIFGLSVSRVAATLAVIIIGYKAGLLDEEVLNGTIILILATCVISSIITQNTSKKIVINNKGNHLNSSNAHLFNLPERILVPVADPDNIGKLIEFALYIKSKESESNVTLLSVFPNEEEVEKKILIHKQKLHDYIIDAAASEALIESIATIDYNVTTGITRVARETMSNIVILGWPGKQQGRINKLLGDTFAAIISSLDKNIFICHFEDKLILHKRIILFAPSLCEVEGGFEIWIKKVIILAKELSLEIIVYCDEKTKEAITEKSSSGGLFQFKPHLNFNDTSLLNNYIQNTDILTIISSKEDQISYHSYVEFFPTHISRQFPHNSRIVIYPQQNHYEGIFL